jgi:hypothetical protein
MRCLDSWFVLVGSYFELCLYWQPWPNSKIVFECTLLQKEPLFIGTHTQVHYAHSNFSLEASKVVEILDQYNVVGNRWLSSMTATFDGLCAMQIASSLVALANVAKFARACKCTCSPERVQIQVCAHGCGSSCGWGGSSVWADFCCRDGGALSPQQWRGRLEDGWNRFACKLQL